MWNISEGEFVSFLYAMALMSPEDLGFQESKVFSLLFFKENYGNSGSLWESCRRARPCMSHLFSRPLCRLVMEV